MLKMFDLQCEIWDKLQSAMLPWEMDIIVHTYWMFVCVFTAKPTLFGTASGYNCLRDMLCVFTDLLIFFYL